MNARARSAPEPGSLGFDLTPATARSRLEAMRIVDIRQPEELFSYPGAIPGAENVPLATLERHARSWDREADYLMVCRSGRRSALAADLLRRMGFVRVFNLSGGMLAWREG